MHTDKKSLFKLYTLIGIAVIGIASIAFIVGQNTSLQGSFRGISSLSESEELSEPPLPTASTSHCGLGLDNAIFADSDGTGGLIGGTTDPDGSWMFPYTSLEEVNEHLEDDDSIENICLNGEFHGQIYISEIELDEFNISGYGGGATINYDSDIAIGFLSSEETNFSVNNLNINSNIYANEIAELDLKNVRIISDDLDMNLYAENLDSVRLIEVEAVNAIRNGLIIKSTNTIEIDDIKITDADFTKLQISDSGSVIGSKIIIDGENQYHISLTNLEYVDFSDLILTNAGDAAVKTDGVEEIIISNSTFISNQNGIYSENSDSITIDSSFFDDGERSIYIDEASSFSLSDSTFLNTNIGTYTNNVDDVSVTTSRFRNNYDRCLYIRDALDVRIDSSVFKNSENPIYLDIDDDLNSNIIVKTSIFYNYEDQGLLIDASNVQVHSNHFRGDARSSYFPYYGANINAIDELKVMNNFFYGNDTALYAFSEDIANIYNNSFSNNNFDINISDSDAIVKNNIFNGSVAYGQFETGDIKDWDLDYNLFSNYIFAIYSSSSYDGLSSTIQELSDWQEEGYDENSIEADPEFAKDSTLGIPTLEEYDLHISSSSPAIEAGTPLDEVSHDIDEDSRDSENPDIGADEY